MEISGRMQDVISKERQNTTKSFVTKAVEYVEESYSDKNISIETVCKKLGVSAAYFSTVFKKETGITPIEYKNRVCIRNAEKMLLISDLSIEEIAEKLGFNSASYFRRTFKVYTGKSPREYKNDIKTELKI